MPLPEYIQVESDAPEAETNTPSPGRIPTDAIILAVRGRLRVVKPELRKRRYRQGV